MTLRTLTITQKMTLDWVIDFIETYGISPTFRDIQHGFDLACVAPVQARLNQLKKRGYITWAKGRSRSIQVLYSSNGNPYETRQQLNYYRQALCDVAKALTIPAADYRQARVNITKAMQIIRSFNLGRDILKTPFIKIGEPRETTRIGFNKSTDYSFKPESLDRSAS